MTNPAETGISTGGYIAYTESNPLVIELNKPFVLNPNLSRKTVPDHVEGAISDDGEEVDVVNFKISGSPAYGAIEFISLNFVVDKFYEDILELDGPIRPIAVSAEIVAEEVEDSVGMKLLYNGRVFFGELNYRDLSREDELFGIIHNDAWTVAESHKQEFLAFPQAAVPKIQFTIFENSPVDETPN